MSGGDYYASHEPDEPERGAPLSEDEQLLQMLNAMQNGMSDGGIADLFNSKGDTLLLNFLEKHAASIEDGRESKLLRMLRTMEKWGELEQPSSPRSSGFSERKLVTKAHAAVATIQLVVLPRDAERS